MCYFLNVTLAVKAAWGSYALGVGVLLILEAAKQEGLGIRV